MTPYPTVTWQRFSELRASFRDKVAVWSAMLPGLLEAQKRLAVELHEDDYPLETAIVYNRALDDIDTETPIRWILVADNPGKKEQLGIQNRYLVGASGKVAENFFARELATDFRKEVIIINYIY
jgi:hypothetical protein